MRPACQNAQILSKWWLPRGPTLVSFAWYFCHYCPCPHSEPQLHSTSPGCPSRHLTQSLTQVPMKSLAFPCVLVHTRPCVPSKSGVSVSLSSVMFLQLGPLDFKAKCSQGSSSQCHTSMLGSLTWGLEVHTPMG